MAKYEIHGDFIKYQNIKLNLSPVLLPFINTMLGVIVQKRKPAVGIVTAERRIPGHRNGSVKLTIYEPKIDKNTPCLIYLHGGAFALKAAPYHKDLACQYALQTPCKVVFVDYRLAPKYAFPIGAEDCYHALQWTYENAEELGIDRKRIAIGGDSAGAALAAAVSMMARDRKGPEICFQMLIYPVTDARQITESAKSYTDTPMWNSILNKKMWELYLKNGVDTKREYASPMEAASLEDLPAAYVEITEFDCLRDEGINYAKALETNGVPVELYETAGTVHGFDMAGDSEIVKTCVIKRIKALKKAFGLSAGNE